MRNRSTRSNRRTVRRSNRMSVRRSNRRTVRRSNRRSVKRSNRRTNRKRNNRRIKKQLYGGAGNYALSSEDESSSLGMSTTSSDARDYITRNPHIFYISSTRDRDEKLWDYPIIKFYKSEFNRLTRAFKPYDKIHTIDGKEVTISKDIHLTKEEKILGGPRSRPGGIKTLVSYEDVWIGKYKVQYGDFLEELKKHIGWPPNPEPKDDENNGKIPGSILKKYKEMFEEINKLAYRILSREKLESKKRKDKGITFYNEISEDELIKGLELSHRPIPIPNTRDFKIKFQNFMGRGRRDEVDDGQQGGPDDPPIGGLLDDLEKPVNKGKQAWVGPKSYETNSDLTDSDNEDDMDEEENELRKKWGPDELDEIKRIIEGNEDAIKTQLISRMNLKKPATWGKGRDLLLFFKYSPTSKEVRDTLNYMIKMNNRPTLMSSTDSSSLLSDTESSEDMEAWGEKRLPKSIKDVRADGFGIKEPDVMPSNKEMITLNRDRFSPDDTNKPLLNEKRIKQLTQSFAIQREKDEEEAKKLRDKLADAKSEVAATNEGVIKATAAAEAANKAASVATAAAEAMAKENAELRGQIETMIKGMTSKPQMSIIEEEDFDEINPSDITKDFATEGTYLGRQIKEKHDEARSRLEARRLRRGDTHRVASDFAEQLSLRDTMKAPTSPAALGELNTRGFRGR